MSVGRLLPATVVASTVAAVVATTAGLPNPSRGILVFWFLLVCPGMGIVPLMGVRNRVTELTLGIACSLVLDALVAESMVVTKLWSPSAGLAILATVSLGGAAVQLSRLAPRPMPAQAPVREHVAVPDDDEVPVAGWNVRALDRLVARSAADDSDEEPVRSAYLIALRPYADAEGRLPPVFDGMIRDIFLPD